MAFVPAPNTVMVEARGTVNSVNVENTLYFTFAGAVTEAAVIDLVDGITIGWFLELRGIMAAEYSLHEWYVTDLTTNTSPTYSIVESPPLAGLVGSSPVLPNNVAFCVSFRTAGRGRSSRGRNYIPALNEGSVTANVVNSLYRTTAISSYEQLMDIASLAPGWTWVVVSRFLNGAERVTALIQPITAVVSVNDTVETQRGRLT